MAFTRIRTIKGRQYLYREERWREGKKVRSKSTFLGVVGAIAGFIGANLRIEPGERAIEKIMEQAERDKQEALAKALVKALPAAIPANEKTVPAGAGTKDAVSQPSSEIAPPSVSGESESEASPQ